MRKSFSLLLVLIALLVAAKTVSAAANRIWVSRDGTDVAGCGGATSPCRTLQFAHDNLVSGGEIDVLDPAGYGSLLIAKSINIVNDGVGVAGVQQSINGANAINIQAQSGDRIYLRGLTIEGLGTAANGIFFLSGASLTVENCVVRDFTDSGIKIFPQNGLANMSFVVSNTTAVGNGNAGITYEGPTGSTAAVQGVIDRVTTVNNQAGVNINHATNSQTKPYIAITNTQASNNTNIGINLNAAFSNSPMAITIDSTFINNNINTGIGAFGPVTVVLGRSVVNANGISGIPGLATGLNNETSPNNFYSYGDNRINQTTDVIGNVILPTAVH